MKEEQEIWISPTFLTKKKLRLLNLKKKFKTMKRDLEEPLLDRLS